MQRFPFGLSLLKPKGRLSSHIQALWTLTIDESPSVQLSKWLQGDACSGILLNLGAAIYLDGQRFDNEVIFLPVSKKSRIITLSPHTRLVGIRFQQGVGSLLFGQTPQVAVTLSCSKDEMHTQALLTALTLNPSHYYQLRKLYQWVLKEVDCSLNLPQGFLEALSILENTQSIHQLTQQASLSQRQLERHYRKWLDMTPNQYLRLMRVNKALQILKSFPNTNLAQLALQTDFSDQAHMTREFKEIAATTPFKYTKLIKNSAS